MRNMINRILLTFFLFGPSILFATFIEAHPERPAIAPSTDIFALAKETPECDPEVVKGPSGECLDALIRKYSAEDILESMPLMSRGKSSYYCLDLFDQAMREIFEDERYRTEIIPFSGNGREDEQKYSTSHSFSWDFYAKRGGVVSGRFHGKCDVEALDGTYNVTIFGGPKGSSVLPVYDLDTRGWSGDADGQIAYWGSILLFALRHIDGAEAQANPTD